MLFVDGRARCAGRAACRGRIRTPGWWAVDVSMGKIQGCSARSLVGELCARGAFEHRTIARPARDGCKDYLAHLPAGLRGSRKTGAPGSDQPDWYGSRQI